MPTPGVQTPFCHGEAERIARSTAYHLKAREAVPPERRPVPGRRGPVGAGTDEEPVGHIRAGQAESPFHGEEYRKVWARLRHRGIPTNAERGRRLMREHHLQALAKAGTPKVHDGTITAEVPDEMWGTDMTTTVTIGEGLAHVFVAVDHCTCECVGLHAAGGGNRFEALEPLRQGVREHFGRFEAKAAEGLAIGHDHGGNHLSDFQRGLKFLKTWRDDGTWQVLVAALRMKVRLKAGRDGTPSKAVIDSQSVKTTEFASEERGYDGGKQVSGRRRPIAVGMMGLLLGVAVTAGSADDGNAASEALWQLDNAAK